MGPSGSGKSTIVQLIERFYDPQGGQILVDGVNLKDMSLRHFRNQIGYVGQEPVLFNQTIEENILYGNPNASPKEIEEACHKANATKIIKKLADGTKTEVGSAGGQLSGGEKQRIALARAFVKKPALLLLDEATSALDMANEKEVQDAIDKVQQGDNAITVVVIAHRLSTIRNAHKIVVLDKGYVREQGTHDTLMKINGGIYANLVHTQEEA